MIYVISYRRWGISPRPEIKTLCMRLILPRGGFYGRIIKCATLVIHGDKDEYGTIAFPHFIAEHVGGPSDILILNDCGHVLLKEQTS